MPAILLHSGKTEHFRALGDTGQPVYHSALQLRKVISRRLPGKERHLATPQRDQQGEGVDWYSDIPGDVIPWSSATEEEREDARIQLEAFRQEVIALHQAPSDGQGGDHEVFSRLVKWVCHFPDEGFVYLVDGLPVITFWGFIHPQADRHANPLLCLYPAAPEVTPPAPAPTSAPTPTPIAEPVPAPVAPARPWWRRWWWLLPLLLLLALMLLLFGLRACSPSPHGPGLTADSSQPGTSSPPFPGSLWSGLDIWPFNRWGGGSTTAPNLAPSHPGVGIGGPSIGASLPEGGMPEASVPDMALADAPPPDMATTGGEPPGITGANEAASSPLAAPGAAPAPGPGEGMPPLGPPAGELAAGDAAPPTLEPLTLPADAPDGAAEFLNGNWRGAGVMDSQSGQPLQVSYVFDQGEGVMYIQRGGSAGMTCAGPVASRMQDGQLQVEAQERARCEDGSHYEMPRVQCHQANGETASCAASYDDEPFPMQLRKAS